MDQPDLRTLQRHTQCVHNLLRRNSGKGRLRSIDREHILHLVRLNVIVHIDDTGCGLE